MLAQLLSVLSAGLLVGAVFAVLGAVQRPCDVVLRYFALVIVLIAVQQVLVVDENATSAVTRLLTNALGVWAAFGKVCFFRTSLRGKRDPRPRLIREGIVVAAVTIVQLISMMLSPPAVRAVIAQPRNGYLVWPFVFALVTTTYLASVSCRVIVWSIRLFVQVRHNRWHRSSLVFVGAASGIALLAGILDIITHSAVFLSPAWIGAVQPMYVLIYAPVAVSFVMFFVGAMVPVAVELACSLPVTVHQVTQYRAMAKLHSVLIREFPEIGMRRYVGIRRRYYSRGIQIRDGLVLLREYYDRGVASTARARCRARGESDAACSILVAVAVLRAALIAHREGRTQPDPYPVPLSGAPDWATDTAWIVRLARVYAATSALQVG